MNKWPKTHNNYITKIIKINDCGNFKTHKTLPCYFIFNTPKRYEAVSLFYVSFGIYVLMSATHAIAFSDMIMKGQLERKQKEAVMT